MKLLNLFFSLLYKTIDRLYMYLCRNSFAKIGKNVTFQPVNSTFSYSTISIGHNVGIGERASFIAQRSHIFIGNNIAIAPNVTIRGGNHRYDIIGKFITDYKDLDKRTEDDEPVYIEDDCWIGANVTILKGVKIGRGSVVGACSLVNKSCPPYSIIAGVPAKLVKFRWDSIEKIIEHEKILYKYSDRIPKESLEIQFLLYESTK